MQLGNFIGVFLARHVSGTYVHGTIRTYTRPKQRLPRPPPIQKLGTENHMLQIRCVVDRAS